jgi:hypothetical protein
LEEVIGVPYDGLCDDYDDGNVILYMPGTIKTNEIEGRNHDLKVLIFVLEASDLSLYQETSSNEKVFSFYSPP